MYALSSTARLSYQLKAVTGSAELTFRGARLEIPSVGEIDNIQCSAIIDKQGSGITRKSSIRSYASYPQWNEVARFQTCNDWTLEFVVVIQLQDGRAMQLGSDLTTINTSGVCNIPIRLGAKCVGELEISVTFIPNYQSFKYLAIGCTLSEQLSYSLTKSILNDLNNTSAEEAMHAIVSEEEILSIFAAVDNFTTFLTQEEVYNGELCLALGIKTTYSGNMNSPLDSADARNYKSLLVEHPFDLPKEVPAHRVATGAKHFLSKLLEELPQPPPVSLGLMEKLLSIYTQALFVPSSSHPAHSARSAHSAHTAETSFNSDELALSWAQFGHFCVVSALWFLQQAVLANRLLAQCTNLTLPELDALRFGFSQYDTDLSGVIPAADLFSLLQDMGEEYNETELGLTESYLDPDRLGVLPFAEFVHWWCE